MRALIAGIVMVSHLLASMAVAQPTDDADAALERRLHAFLREIRCLVCQNETLADSRAELAVDLRQEIRARMLAGRSDGEIREFLTARYGDFVLYRPPLTPRTYLLWFSPFAVLVGGLVVLYRAVKRFAASALERPPSSAELRRVRRLLDAAERDVRSVRLPPTPRLRRSAVASAEAEGGRK